MHKNKITIDTTTNSRVYRMALKKYRAKTYEISCDRCPYHNGENYRRRIKRSWKKFRKTQYKTKEVIND